MIVGSEDDQVARPNMLSQKFILGEVGNKKGYNQRPVAYSNEGVPNPYRVLLSCHCRNPVRVLVEWAILSR